MARNMRLSDGEEYEIKTPFSSWEAEVSKQGYSHGHLRPRR